MTTDDQPPLEGHVVSGLQQPFTETTDPHGLRARTTDHGTEYVCACGQWDGWAKGPASTRFVHNQHNEHLRNVAAAEASAEQARMQIIEGETP